jgi:para-aminobenzoate synthetase component I
MIEITLGYRPDSLALFQRLLPMPRAVLLHSAERSSPQARYDIMAADPRHWIRYECNRLGVDGGTQVTDDPLAALRSLLPLDGPVALPHFRHGFIGYFGYGLQHRQLGASAMPPNPTRLPDLQGGIYTWSVVTDHVDRTTRLHACDVGASYLQSLVHRLEGDHQDQQRLTGLVCAPFQSEPVEAYREAFTRIQHYLHAGDCYQVNLARHYHAECLRAAPHAGWLLYRQLLARQPGAFAAYLDTPDAAILSFSPERLLRFKRERIETSPIKGTASRGADDDEDRALAAELLASSKNRAENLMIVDLLRNDLGRVCVPGSIRVRKLFELLSLRNVHHLVSHIEGLPRPDADALDCLRSLFPGGSITGAPKQRAMQIINELEPVGRSVYCGAIGYLDASGTMDLNIAIRTLVLETERLHCWGGGAVVAESDCDRELMEIDAKIGRLLQPLDVAATSSAPSSA